MDASSAAAAKLLPTRSASANGTRGQGRLALSPVTGPARAGKREPRIFALKRENVHVSAA
eukprot:NODE_5956_length_664_cov_3.217886_g5043_i0.p4 GENE.NODE_5956_length_664_cov_3.217886_g5043_i0~~NODE_5956_length_664_cov_3.217886_g5043_i0.p4  ORF type:complete len:60 (+),score=0.53 NODE_5956_length_664_cov_3.217886_g5043_i0:176-355(+)